MYEPLDDDFNLHNCNYFLMFISPDGQELYHQIGYEERPGPEDLADAKREVVEDIGVPQDFQCILFVRDGVEIRRNRGYVKYN
jgi:hypothetical protein